MSVLHRKQILPNRPDEADATLVRAHEDWMAPHITPDFLAYMGFTSTPPTIVMPGTNQPDTEIPFFRSKYDFTYVDQARLIFGSDFGSAKIRIKYSTDLVTWSSFDGVGGPFVQQAPAINNVPTMYASPWVTLSAAAKGDRYIGLFYGQNSNVVILRVMSVFLYVR